MSPSSVVVGRDAKEDLRFVAVIGCCRSRRQRGFTVSSSVIVGRDAKLRIYGVSSSSVVVGRDAKEDLRFVAVIGCCRSRRQRGFTVSSSVIVGRDAKLRIYGVSSSSVVVGRDAKEDLRCVVVIGCCRSRR